MRLTSIRRSSTVLLLTASAVSIAGCGEDVPPTETPAHIENPVAEADLTRIQLTDDAVRRIGIETAKVERRSVAGHRTVGGELSAAPGAAVVLTAPEAAAVLAPQGGRIPTAGANISGGQALLRLVVLAPGGDLASPREALQVAEARVTNARAKAQRALDLLNEGVGSRAEYEDAQAELQSAEAGFQATQARVDLLRTGTTAADVGDLSSIVLTAPAAGQVSAVHVAAGQTVAAGAPLLEIVNARLLWVRVPVYAGDLAQFDDQAAATVLTTAGASEGVTAERIRGPSTANSTANSIDLFYRFDNSGGRFRPGQRVSVRVPLQAQGDARLVVPWRSVVHDIYGGSWVYEVIGSATYARRRVEVTDVIGDDAVISRGLPEGASIVTVGAAELFSTEFGGASH